MGEVARAVLAISREVDGSFDYVAKKTVNLDHQLHRTGYPYHRYKLYSAVLEDLNPNSLTTTISLIATTIPGPTTIYSGTQNPNMRSHPCNASDGPPLTKMHRCGSAR